MSSVQAESRWGGRERLWFAAVVAVAIIMYAPTFRFLVGKWLDDAQYSLAFLVPFVSGYFTWRRWPEVLKLKRSSSVWGLIVILAALALHLAGVVLDISGPSGVSLLLCLFGGCMYFHSVALVRTLAFPLAYTAFMVPVPGGVIDLVGFPMQMWSSGSSAVLLRLIGLEVSRSGVNMAVPGFEFQVAQACSGMSSLVALVGVTAVFAYIVRLPVVCKWILFLLALPVALAANMVRITTIALVGYQWGQDAAMDVFHDWSSPILFVSAVMMLFVISTVMEWLSKRRTTN